MFYGEIHYKWPFSIAMLNYQRVSQFPMISLVKFWNALRKQRGRYPRSNQLSCCRSRDLKLMETSWKDLVQKSSIAMEFPGTSVNSSEFQWQFAERPDGFRIGPSWTLVWLKALGETAVETLLTAEFPDLISFRAFLMVRESEIFKDFKNWLVVWNMNFVFPYIGNFIIPTDFHSIIFQRGRLTTNQNTLSQSLSSYLTSGYIWSGRPKPLQRPPIVSPGGFPAEICDESVTNPISHGHSKWRWYFRQWIWYKVYEDHSKTKEFEDRKG